MNFERNSQTPLSVKSKDECLPIKLLEDLKFFDPSKVQRHTVEPLYKRVHAADWPKTLLCHDFKGGYLDDRFLNGTDNINNYYFLHWSMVDIFVYFSHHLVTIPPCSWISAAHRNGVKILGTFITEWNAGVDICNSIFTDVETVHHYCMQLVKIAEVFKFDGWLVNIENKLNLNQVPLLLEFVRCLTQEMHNSQESSLVIWYDSVIDTGELKWQNALNKRNKDFFLACDGIFLNYNWNESTLRASVEEAGPRKADVFVGVDVFGRGCPGGGGFFTNKAVMEARNFNLSVAIFAPGWVFETLDTSDFKANQYKFWAALEKLCAPRATSHLPYYSSFCPGLGQKLFRNGKVGRPHPWFNLSLQQPQPSFHFNNCPTKGASITLYSEDAFNGGGCLQLSNSTQNNTVFEILSSNFLINRRCGISYTFKPLTAGLKVALTLGISDGLKFYQVELSDKVKAENDGRFSCICSNCFSTDLSIPLNSSKVIKHFDDELSWIKRKYRVHCHYNKECYIKKVQVLVSSEGEENPNLSVLLGELSILPFSDRSTFSYKDLVVTKMDGKEHEVLLECLLEWTVDKGSDSSDLYLHVGSSKQYICTTSQLSYKYEGCIDLVPEVEFFLVPSYLGKTLLPMFLNVSLNQ